jgi:hypothetical protein
VRLAVVVEMMAVAVEAIRPVADQNAVIVIRNNASHHVMGVVNQPSPTLARGVFRGTKRDEKSRAVHGDHRVRSLDRPVSLDQLHLGVKQVLRRVMADRPMQNADLNDLVVTVSDRNHPTVVVVEGRKVAPNLVTGFLPMTVDHRVSDANPRDTGSLVETQNAESTRAEVRIRGLPVTPGQVATPAERAMPRRAIPLMLLAAAVVAVP